MAIVRFERTEIINAIRGTQIKCQKWRVNSVHKRGYIKERVLSKAEVQREDQSSEKRPGVAVCLVQLTKLVPHHRPRDLSE